MTTHFPSDPEDVEAIRMGAFLIANGLAHTITPDGVKALPIDVASFALDVATEIVRQTPLS